MNLKKKTMITINRKEIAKFFVFFISIFLVLFLVINFATFYKNIRYEVFELLPANIEILGDAATSDVYQKKDKPVIYNKPNSVVISKIEVEAPIIIPKSSSQVDILLALKKGVAMNPDSVKPGKKGTTVISGHSSPNLTYSGSYNTVFSLLNKLDSGDKITIYFKKQKFMYLVKNKYIFYPDEAVLPPEDKTKSTLILMSCWPIGTNWKRIAVEAKQIF